MRCLAEPMIMKSVLSALSLSQLFVIQPEISLRQSPSCVREISGSVVDKDIYTSVLSACIWLYQFWLWIRELSGVVYRVNNSSPRTDPWGRQQNMETASQNQCPIYFDWDIFVENERIQVSAGPSIPYQSERRSRRTQYSLVSKAANNLIVLVLWPSLYLCIVMRYEVSVERFL